MADTTIEQMVKELEAAGWAKAMSNVWKSPSGHLFYGPAGAWRKMRNFPQLSVRKKPREVKIVPASEVEGLG